MQAITCNHHFKHDELWNIGPFEGYVTKMCYFLCHFVPHTSLVNACRIAGEI